MEILKEYLTMGTLAFFVCTLVNVILSTIKSILTVKASRINATLINAIAYGFYAIVIKQLADTNMLISVTVTVICNLIGVYFSMWLLDKFKKDKLWIVEVNTEKETCDIITKNLLEKNIGYTEIDVVGQFKYNKNIKIYCYTQKDSAIVKHILKDLKMVKYNIVESRGF